jgi:hypothetical protein
MKMSTKEEVCDLLKIQPLPLPGKGLDETYYTEEGAPYTLRKFFDELEAISGVSPELCGSADSELPF